VVPVSGPHGGEQEQFYAEDRRRISLAYQQRCPRCHAEPGGMCIDADGRVWYQLHPERLARVTDEEGQR
jgi:sugar lactone lactonase YvrE